MIFEPIVFTMRQPPVSVPERDGGVGARARPRAGRRRSAGSVPGGDEQGEDDAHRLLGVVGAVAEAERGGRDELPAPEAPVQAFDLR